MIGVRQRALAQKCGVAPAPIGKDAQVRAHGDELAGAAIGGVGEACKGVAAAVERPGGVEPEQAVLVAQGLAGGDGRAVEGCDGAPVGSGRQGGVGRGGEVFHRRESSLRRHRPGAEGAEDALTRPRHPGGCEGGIEHGGTSCGWCGGWWPNGRGAPGAARQAEGSPERGAGGEAD